MDKVSHSIKYLKCLKEAEPLAKKKSGKFIDPYYQREKNKYSHPVPSREAVIQVLEEEGKPLGRKRLFKLLGIKKIEEQEALTYRLKAMLRDGQLMQDRKERLCLLQKIDLIRGRVSAHPDGYGFLIPDDGTQDLFLNAREMRRVMHGDIVLAFDVGQDKRGRRLGDIHEVLERANKTIVGQFYSEAGVAFVEPENRRIPYTIAIAPESTLDAKDGQVVVVELLIYPSKRQAPLGRVIDVLGDHMAPGMEIDIAIHAHDLPNVWPQEVIEEVDRLPDEVSEKDYQGRADLREMDFVTIDGADAKDFDDAVFCKPKPKGGWLLYVAIADVSHYVKPGSALDKEAYNRATSVYFPGRVIPMLPEKLSNGLCSLNPKVDRLVMVCEMNISTSGRVTRSRFYRSVIHSKARLTYGDVAKWLTHPETKPQEVPDLTALYALFKTLFKARKARGAMEFDSQETQILFNEEKKIDAIVPQRRNEAHRLIEECMLAANVTAAKLLLKTKIPALYRDHAKPSEKKLEALKEFLLPLSLSFSGGKKPTAKDFSQVLEQAQDRPDKPIIETVMLRSQMQAEYSEVNQGHFGLAYSAYTHFTSPIRRYPDLLVHRALGHHLDRGEPEKYLYNKKQMHQMGEHCSTNERRADEATRDVTAWLKCEHMLSHIGETYWGRIVSVTHFGVFVALDDMYIEGLVHMTSLPTDYYQYDKFQHTLSGVRRGQVYRLGDKLQVQVIKVNLDDRKIDFDLAQNSEE